MEKLPVYKLVLLHNKKIVEIYAREVYQSNLMGFIEARDFIFEQKSKVVIDPKFEELKKDFKNVNSSYIPMQNIIRIDEMSTTSTIKISDSKLENTSISNSNHLTFISQSQQFNNENNDDE